MTAQSGLMNMTHHLHNLQAGAIENRILLLRNPKVIIDADLAEFYGVSTKRLNEQLGKMAGLT